MDEGWDDLIENVMSYDSGTSVVSIRVIIFCQAIPRFLILPILSLYYI